ncbi:restriction endonuclease subunit S [Gemella sp. zg-570]|uniref:restriction endonuclease subunit S n=1 Tax=Gemella sp. zg-570 TaxID=2840371 RepID=UPI001C0C5C24|nr:restriction endonuclease subunit S [Gemella sp. zg-570]QWQ38259.1 restriction endonuclease subunit S [Gemella sp. zg-570]
MNKLDIIKWKVFEMSELFDINPTKYHKLTNKDLMQEDGKNPVIVNSSYNNGIGGYTNYDITEKGNVITFSDTTTSDSIFYQPNDFVGYPHVQVLKPIKYKEKWNKDSLIFFTVIFKKKASLMNYDYVNKFTRTDALKLNIKLPVKSDGSPDFEYMENFVKRLETRERESSSNLLQHLENSKTNRVDTSKWREFIIGDLFEKIVKPNVLHSREVVEDEDGIPYVVRTKFNNGIKYRVKKSRYMKPSPKGVISFGAENASFFYQKESFVSGRDIYYIDTQHLNEKVCLFLVSCLQTLSKKYSYSNGLFPNLLKKEKIKLPVKTDNTPDWEQMENYITKLSLNIIKKLAFIK